VPSNAAVAAAAAAVRPVRRKRKHNRSRRRPEGRGGKDNSLPCVPRLRKRIEAGMIADLTTEQITKEIGRMSKQELQLLAYVVAWHDQVPHDVINVTVVFIREKRAEAKRKASQ
jgi:hypothetical protein